MRRIFCSLGVLGLFWDWFLECLLGLLLNRREFLDGMGDNMCKYNSYKLAAANVADSIVLLGGLSGRSYCRLRRQVELSF